MEYEEKKSINIVAIIVPIAIILFWSLAWFLSVNTLKKQFTKLGQNVSYFTAEKIKRAGFPFRRKLIIENIKLDGNGLYNKTNLLIPKLIVDGILFSNTSTIRLAGEPRIIDPISRQNIGYFKFYKATEFPKITFVGTGKKTANAVYEDHGYQIISMSPDNQEEVLSDNQALSKITLVSQIDKKLQLLNSHLTADVNSAINSQKQAVVVDITFTSPTEDNLSVKESIIQIQDLVFDSGSATLSLEGQLRKKINSNSFSGDTVLKIINFPFLQQSILNALQAKINEFEQIFDKVPESKNNPQLVWITNLMKTVASKLPKVTTDLANKNEKTSGNNAYFNIGKSQNDTQIFINGIGFKEVFNQLTTSSKNKNR